MRRNPREYPCSEWGHNWIIVTVGNARKIKRCTECGAETSTDWSIGRTQPRIPSYPPLPFPRRYPGSPWYIEINRWKPF